MRTTGSRGTLLLLACVLVVLPGCGGGTAVDAEAMLRITPPDDPDDVAIAIGPGGSVEVLRGLTEKDRAAGRRYPSRHVAPASADEIRAVADEREGWHSLQRALDRAVGTGTSDVALTLLEAGGGHRTLRFVLRCWAAQERAAHQRFHVTISVVEGKRRLAVDLPGGAWLRTHGCQREEAWSSPWAGGPPPAAFVDLLYRVLAVVDHEPSALDVRVEVDGGTDETPCTIADVASVLEAFLGVGVTTLDLGLGTVHGSRKPGVVETGLRWLAAHQTSEGDWHGDAWPQWCDRERMPTSEVGDGDPRFDVGATGLALTAFLGAGYTHRGRHPFAKTVTLGLRDLKHRQAADGTYAEPGTPYRARNQALAALALGRAVELTESPVWKGAAARAGAALPDVWRDEPADAVATGYAVLAAGTTEDRAFREDLHAACRTLARGQSDLEVAIGIAGCLLLGDDPRDARREEAILGILRSRVGTLGLHEAFFVAIAAWRLRGETFKEWSATKRPEQRRKERSGHPCCLGGSWDVPEGCDLPGGRIEATALPTMTLEIYYRYDRALR